jgi:hypothetical protein
MRSWRRSFRRSPLCAGLLVLVGACATAPDDASRETVRPATTSQECARLAAAFAHAPQSMTPVELGVLRNCGDMRFRDPNVVPPPAAPPLVTRDLPLPPARPLP